MKKTLLLTTLATTVLIIVACNDKPDLGYYSDEEYALIEKSLNLPETPYKYNIDLRGRSIAGIVDVSSDKATLGRVLFYDKKLSKDQTISCASCHKQELAFGDDHAVSTGVFNRQGDRNSIALASVLNFREAGYSLGALTGHGKHFFWDNRAPTAHEQSRASMSNPREMDMSMPEIVAAVQAQPFYAPLFKKAFGDDHITEERITLAIVEFVQSLVSIDSKFDIALSREKAVKSNFNDHDFFTDFSMLTDAENRGKLVYQSMCSNCHGANLSTTAQDVGNNGLDLESADPGVGAITQNPLQIGMFKVSSLRNVALTAPYMHDGRFQTLEQVIDHYSTGVQNHPNLSYQLRESSSGPAKRMNFTAEQKADLITFFNTLTDPKLVTEVRFSDPFKR